MASLWRQPLAHFIVIGGMFYAGVSALSPAQEDFGKTILVDRAALLTFIQQRTQIFEPDFAAARLDGMSAEERALLKQEFVEEEALYRDAKRLGLDQQDYVIRRRMVQKMDYAAASAQSSAVFTDAQVEAYYAANAQAYRTQDMLYFDHIFAKDAQSAQLAADKITGEDFAQLGERFAYGSSFEGLTKDETADIFGPDFAEALWARSSDAAAWKGPIASKHGAHFVRLRRKDPAGQPALADVRRAVEADMAYEAEQEARIKAIDRIVASYAVRDES